MGSQLSSQSRSFEGSEEAGSAFSHAFDFRAALPSTSRRYFGRAPSLLPLLFLHHVIEAAAALGRSAGRVRGVREWRARSDLGRRRKVPTGNSHWKHAGRRTMIQRLRSSKRIPRLWPSRNASFLAFAMPPAHMPYSLIESSLDFARQLELSFAEVIPE